MQVTGSEILVLGGGITLIVMIYYYFFGPKSEEIAMKQNDKQRIDVVVEGGYDPANIEVKLNVPVEIVFDRRDKGECTEWVTFGELPTIEGREIKSRLPEGKKTSVSFTPTVVGKYDFACGMGMVHGKLVVKT